MSHAASKARQPTRHHVLTLYRRLLQQSTAFKDYNFRETALRKTKEQFRANQSVQEVSEVSRLYQAGLSQLAVLQRQSVVHNLYHHQPYIIETVQGEKANAGRGWRLRKRGQDTTPGEIEGDIAKEKEQLTSFTVPDYGAHKEH